LSELHSSRAFQGCGTESAAGARTAGFFLRARIGGELRLHLGLAVAGIFRGAARRALRGRSTTTLPRAVTSSPRCPH
jgi:hypothetical protein